MNISLWMIAANLKKYNKVICINNGSCTIKNIRALTKTTKEYLPKDSLLLCYSKDYDPALEEGILCKNLGDYIIFSTNDMGNIYNDILDLMEFYNGWESELLQIINQDFDVQTILDIGQRVLPNPLVLVDAGFYTVAHTVNQPIFSNIDSDIYEHLLDNSFQYKLQDELISAFIGQDGLDIPYYKEVDGFPFQVLIKNLHYKQEQIGYLMCWESCTEITTDQIQLLSLLGKIIEEIHEQHLAKTLLKSKSKIFSDILSNNQHDTHSALLSMNAIGWKESDEKILIKIATTITEKQNMAYIRNIIMSISPHIYCFEFENYIVSICNLSKYPLNFLVKSIQIYLNNFHLCAGCSYVFFDVTALKSNYEQASIALKYGKHASGSFNRCEDYLQDYIYSIVRSNAPDSIISDIIYQLKKNDEKKQTDYINTLYTYLINERDQTKTSTKLHIHRNTLIRRLDRLEDKWGINLDNPETRFLLLISIIKLDI